MSTKNKTSDGVSKGKVTESLWTRAFTADTEWSDKVSLDHGTLDHFKYYCIKLIRCDCWCTATVCFTYDLRKILSK